MIEAEVELSRHWPLLRGRNLLKRFAFLLHYRVRVFKPPQESFMPIEASVVTRNATDNKRPLPFDKRSSIGNWEMHSWGDGKFPGMAAVSAITSLQIGATLAPTPADRIALNKAVEYLMDALAPQLKSFQRTIR
jgi:hypothetical protein